MSDKHVFPVGDQVVLKKHKLETKTDFGLVLSEENTEASLYAEVVGVPEKAKDFPCKEGDLVVYAPHGVTNIKHSGVEYMIIHKECILAVIK